MSSADASPAPDVRADTIARNAAFALGIQITGAAFTAALTLFLVRALDPSGYGVFALAVATGSVLLLPSDLGISSSAARFIAERRGDPRAIAALLADALTLKLLVSGVLSLVLVLLAGPIADAYDEPSLAWPLRAVALAVFGQSLMMLLGASFVAQGRIAVNFRIDVSESLVEASSSIVLVLLGAGATGAAFGRTIGYAVGALVGLAVTLRLLGRPVLTVGRLRRGHRREIARYAGPLFVVDVAYTLFGAINPMLVGAYLGSAAVGIFHAPLRLVAFLHYPGYALASGVAPRMVRHEQEGRRTDAFVDGIRGLVLLYGAMTVPFVVWADPIADLVLGSAYAESGDVLRGLAPVIFLSGIAPLVSLSANYLGEARRRVPVAVATVVATLGVTIGLIGRYEVVGAAIGSSVGMAVYVLGHLYVCRRAVDVPLRPLLVTFMRMACAAGAMTGILLLAGTDDLALADWLLTPPLSLLAYVAALVVTGELSRGDLDAARGAVRRVRS